MKKRKRGKYNNEDKWFDESIWSDSVKELISAVNSLLELYKIADKEHKYDFKKEIRTTRAIGFLKNQLTEEQKKAVMEYFEKNKGVKLYPSCIPVDKMEDNKEKQEGAITSEDIANVDKANDLTQTDFKNADNVITDITEDKSKDENKGEDEIQ